MISLSSEGGLLYVDCQLADKETNAAYTGWIRISLIVEVTGAVVTQFFEFVSVILSLAVNILWEIKSDSEKMKGRW